MNDSNPVLKQFEQLARKAAEEPAIQVDVTDRVLNSLRRHQPEALSERVAVRFFAGTLTVAVMSIAIVMALSTNELPFEFIQPFVSTMP